MAMTVTIIGQGLAGSLLAWELTRAGAAWHLYDPGHGEAASRVGAGIINPLTGRRWVPTWRVAEWRGAATEVYREIETELGTPLYRPMRIWRAWRNPDEQAFLEQRAAVQPEVRRWLGGLSAAGAWIEGAAQVDTAALVAGLRERWVHEGALTERRATESELAAAASRGPVIWCTGAGLSGATTDVIATWQRAGGEILTGRTAAALDESVILNDGHWVLPLSGGRMRVGATYEREVERASPTVAGRDELWRAARRLTGCEFTVTEQAAAVRLTTTDKRPVVGWWPGRAGHGLLGGLASKGALWAPALAQQWVAHVRAGAAFDEEADAARFAVGAPSRDTEGG